MGNWYEAHSLVIFIFDTSTLFISVIWPIIQYSYLSMLCLDLANAGYRWEDVADFHMCGLYAKWNLVKANGKYGIKNI